MNCKQCGGSTTAKQTPRGQAFECNQDNGDCYGPNGYPTTTWGQSRNANGGGARRFPQNAGQTTARAPSGDARGAEIKWQVCLKGACEVVAHFASMPPGSGEVAKAIISLARELYAAKPTVAKRAPAPEPEPDNEETVEVF